TTAHSLRSAHQLFHCCNDPPWLEPELPLQFTERRRSPESLHRDHPAGRADVPLPSEGGGLLDRYAGSHVGWQHAPSIIEILVLEYVPRRHRDHAGTDALCEQLFVRLHG